MATANETYFLNQSYEDLSGVVDDLLDIDGSLLMSLLEDSQVEDDNGDDQGLEVVNQDSCSEIYSSSDDYSEGYRCSDFEEMESCSTSPDHHHLGFEWMDVEMNYSSLGNETNTYFIDHHFTDEIEVANMIDYSQVCYYGMINVEEDVDYIDLWQ